MSRPGRRRRAAPPPAGAGAARRPVDPDPALAAAAQAVRAAALARPETAEEFPWGHSAFKVRGRTFCFMALHAGRLELSMKLPHSREFALEYPFTRPTGYGLGRSGWVSAGFDAGTGIPLDVLVAWLDESFRAMAPKTPAGGSSARAGRGSGAGRGTAAG